MIKIIDSRGLKLGRFLVAVLVALMLIALVPSETRAAEDEKYNGGSGDGFTLLTSEVMSLGGSPVRYAGGSRDGFTLLTSEVMSLGGTILRYAGGSGDGFAILTSNAMSLSGNPPTPGDCNWDGEVNAADITYIAHVVALDPAYEVTDGCDANLDGNINAVDITETALLAI